jgi:hypothetical protein
MKNLDNHTLARLVPMQDQWRNPQPIVNHDQADRLILGVKKYGYRLMT